MADDVKKEELMLKFKLDQIQRKDWYRTFTTQFYKKLDEVESSYKMRLTYDDTHFDDRIASVRYNFEKQQKEMEQILFQEQVQMLKKEAEDEVEQINIERQQRIYENPDIIFQVHRNEVKEKKEWTIIKWSLYDKWIITRVNEIIEVLHNYRIWLS